VTCCLSIFPQEDRLLGGIERLTYPSSALANWPTLTGRCSAQSRSFDSIPELDLCTDSLGDTPAGTLFGSRLGACKRERADAASHWVQGFHL